MSQPPHAVAQQQHLGLREAQTRELHVFETRHRMGSLTLLALFLVGAVCFFVYLSDKNILFFLLSGACFLLYGGLLILMERIKQHIHSCTLKVAFHNDHLARMVDPLPLKEPPHTPHPMALDLGLDGAHSLLARADRTKTQSGHALLLKLLSLVFDQNQGDVLPTLETRQHAVRELAEQLVFRREFECTLTPPQPKMGHTKIDLIRFESALNDLALLSQPVLWTARVLSILFLVTSLAMFLEPFGLRRTLIMSVLSLLALLNIMFATIFGRNARQRLERVSKHEGLGHVLATSSRTMAQTSFVTPLLKESQSVAQQFSVAAKKLQTILGYHDGTKNMLYPIFAYFFLTDMICYGALAKWTHVSKSQCISFLNHVAQMEALVSLSVLLHEDEHATMPTVLEGDSAGPFFSATDLGHPLLVSHKRVRNNLAIQSPKDLVILTGSNMAGKSTLLRSIGLNLSLAFAGGPVIASTFAVKPLRLRVALSASDSLASGSSYFKAELRRIDEVISHLEEGAPVFFLLDELLKGTNANAMHQGAISLLLHLLERGALGVVATHDMKLTEIKTSGIVTNYHFTDVVQDQDVVFDYKLRSGVVQTSNALRLLSGLGIKIHHQ